MMISLKIDHLEQLVGRSLVLYSERLIYIFRSGFDECLYSQLIVEVYEDSSVVKRLIHSRPNRNRAIF